MDRAAKWIVLLVVGGGFGLAVLVFACVWGYQSYVLSRVGVTTQGHVVEMSISESEDSGKKTYFPVVEFWSEGEKPHRFNSRDGYSEGEYKGVGATVSVLYDPGNPANARLADVAEPFWVGPLVVGLLGFVFLAVGIGAFFLM